jgi:hypothetical protein
VDGHTSDALRIGPLRLSAHRAIYGTVIVMAALAVFDEEDSAVTTLDVVGMVLAPLAVLAAAHLFSDAADRQIVLARPLHLRDWGRLLAENLQYLYVAVPPLVVLVFAFEEGWDASETVGLLLLLGAGSLMFWGWLMAERARLAPRWCVMYAIAYGLLGLVILALEIVLTGH